MYYVQYNILTSVMWGSYELPVITSDQIMC